MLNMSGSFLNFMWDEAAVSLTYFSLGGMKDILPQVTQYLKKYEELCQFRSSGNIYDYLRVKICDNRRGVITPKYTLFDRDDHPGRVHFNKPCEFCPKREFTFIDEFQYKNIKITYDLINNHNKCSFYGFDEYDKYDRYFNIYIDVIYGYNGGDTTEGIYNVIISTKKYNEKYYLRSGKYFNYNFSSENQAIEFLNKIEEAAASSPNLHL